MGRKKYYSVYDRRTDMPVIIHGTASECMKATGLARNTFYGCVGRTRKGIKRGHYEVFADDEEDDP